MHYYLEVFVSIEHDFGPFANFSSTVNFSTTLLFALLTVNCSYALLSYPETLSSATVQLENLRCFRMGSL